MKDILNKNVLPKLEVLQNQWVILGIVGGVIAIAVLVLILKILRKRELNKAVNLTNFEGASDKPLEENYELIIKRIKRFGKKYKSILFASVEPAALSVTLPTNVAIGLVKDKKRCLLIDLDLKRDAIAKAFGLDDDKNSLSPKAVQTNFENLWVWPAHNFTQLRQMNIKMIVEKALERFDFILINAPSLVSSPDHRQIISVAQAAFLCSRESSEAARLAELMKPSNCTVIGHIQTPS